MQENSCFDVRNKFLFYFQILSKITSVNVVSGYECGFEINIIKICFRNHQCVSLKDVKSMNSMLATLGTVC